MEEFKLEFGDLKLTITSEDISKCLLTIVIGLCVCASAYAATQVTCESTRSGCKPGDSGSTTDM